MNLLSRRIPTILGLLLFGAVVAASWWYIKNNAPQTNVAAKPSKVKITNVSDNKFTVSWVTQNPALGEIEYGQVGDKLTNIAYDDRSGEEGSDEFITHHVTVDELQPNTSYAFRILSGGSGNRFDNNGSPYSVTTGPTISVTPPAKSIYGEVSGKAELLSGTIVYLTLPGSAPASTLVTSTGNYSLPVSIMRTSDLSSYIEYDPAATLASISLESGSEQSLVTVNTANAEPVPKISLGQDADYTTQVAQVAQVEPNSPTSSVNPTLAPSGTPSSSGSAITVFNVEPFAGSENLSGTGDVTLINPSKEGETLATTKPEFRGTGPTNTIISITVHSTSNFADTVTVANDNTWAWTPPSNLSEGEHTITIAYIDLKGVEQTITRTFTVSKALAADGDPAFESTPSASTTTSTTITSPSPTATPGSYTLDDETLETSASASPREQMPSTESGVPVTGIFTPTLVTAILGILIIISGSLLIAI